MQPNALAGKRVLIAEDEPLIALEHAAQLAQAGADIVATCATARGAMDCVRKKPIDVAVVDFMLADGNSEALQTALKRKHIPFLVVSVRIPAHRGQPFRRIADSVPVISDSF